MRYRQNTLKIPSKFEKCLEISSLQVSPQFNFNQIEIKKQKLPNVIKWKEISTQKSLINQSNYFFFAKIKKELLVGEFNIDHNEPTSRHIEIK
jgi:hypothetical protein